MVVFPRTSAVAAAAAAAAVAFVDLLRVFSLAFAFAVVAGSLQADGTACEAPTLQLLVDGVADGTYVCDPSCGALTCAEGNVVTGISLHNSIVGDGSAATAAAAASGGSIPPSIRSLAALKFLDLRGVAVTGQLPRSLGSLRNLTTLRISGAPRLTGQIPASVGSLVALEALELSENSLTGPLNSSLCGLAQLSTMNLRANNLGVEVVQRLVYEVASVWSNTTGAWNASSGEDPVLVQVNRSVLADVDVPHHLPDCLGLSLNQLTSLDLSENRLVGTVPASLASLSNLKSIRMGSNSLSGAIPSLLFGGWKCNDPAATTPSSSAAHCTHDSVIEEVALSDNMLNGTLPATAGAFLTQLSLARNILTGTLPVSLLTNGSATLAILDISSNRLSGSVPVQLEELTSLVAFLASENQLTGTLPLPGGPNGNALIVMASSNPISSVRASSWCSAMSATSTKLRSLQCGLADTDVPCQLMCGVASYSGDDVDLDARCGAACACALNFTEYFRTSVASTSDAMATALAHGAQQIICPEHGDGDVCEFSCSDGYEPGFVDPVGGGAICDDVEDASSSSNVRAGLPAHVLTCSDGSWLHTDVEGLGHGCVEAVCPSLSRVDMPHAVPGVCANTPSGGKCLVECLPGFSRRGSPFIVCDRGAWVVDETVCEKVENALDFLTCQPLNGEVLPNVAIDSCKDTPSYTMSVSATTASAGQRSSAELQLEASVYDRLVLAVGAAAGQLDLTPVPCSYSCAPGFHANPDAPSYVVCDMGRWVVPSDVTCTARSCDEFWSPWSEECTGYCPGGRNPGQEYRTFSYTVPDEVADVAAAKCGIKNGFVESRNCTEWPRCLSSCDEHWSDWSECSNFCSGGVIMRTFGILSGAAPPPNLEAASNMSWSWDEFLAMTCVDEQGDIEQQNCTNWDTCETTGIALSVILVVGGCVTAATLLILKDIREEREIRTTRMGKSFLRVAGGDMKQAVKMLKTMQYLQQTFPDLKPKSIWFAMDRARRTRDEAAAVLRDAHELMRDHTDMQLVEALERADWQSPVRLRTIGNLGRLLVWQKCHGPEERAEFKQAVQDAKAVAELLQTAGSDDEDVVQANCRAACNKHPYFHILCHQPWRHPEDQMWALSEMLQHLPLMYLDHLYLPRPCYLRRTPPHNVLQLALERRCSPSILEVLATGAPRHAENVPSALFGDYFAYWETQGLLLGHGLDSRHLESKSSPKGRLLQRSSSLNKDAASTSQSQSNNKGKAGNKIEPRGRSKGKLKEEDDWDKPVVNRRKLQKSRDEELATLSSLMEESAQTRLGARISRAWWSAEGAGTGNGSAGFVPPAVKARELAQCLALYAESLLDPEWVPAFDESAAVSDTGSLLKQLFRMGGMAEAMNAVTPTIMGDVNVTNWWVDEDGDADGGDYDDSNQSGAGTGDRRDWYGGSLGPDAIAAAAAKQKAAQKEPEIYPVTKQRKMTQEEEEDEMWLATKKGLNLAQIVPLRHKTKGANATERPSPWKPMFVTGFLAPVLKVLKRFLTMEIKAASPEDQVARLRAVVDVLLQGFQGTYDVVAKESIDTDYDMPSFREEMAKINSRLTDEREAAANLIASHPPGTKFGNGRNGVSAAALADAAQGRALQTATTLEELYLSAHRVMPRFRLFMEDIGARSRSMDGSGVAPLKSMYRSMEKTAFRPDGDQWSANCVLDVVRGSLRFETMRAFARCLRIIGDYEGVQIRRLKDRFSDPTPWGWRDCLLNISFADDPDRHICELQLVHHQLVEKEESGAVSHNDLVTHRAASELVRAVTEQQKADSKQRRGSGGKPFAAAGHRRQSGRTDAVYLKHLAQQQAVSVGEEAVEMV